MGTANDFLNYSATYVLICGSYKNNPTNDKLCDLLGAALGTHGVGLISAGGEPGLRVAESMDKTLNNLNLYAPGKIITVYRKKGKAEITVKRIGSVSFVRNSLFEIRSKLFSIADILIVIGGGSKTNEEVLFAQELIMPIIPVGMSGGTAKKVWLQHYQVRKYMDEESFLQLNSQSPFVAVNAISRSLRQLVVLK